MDVVRKVRTQLVHGTLDGDEAVAQLEDLAHRGATRAMRLAAAELLGDLAGRAHQVEWVVAERAAFALLELARLAEGRVERTGVLAAMGRGFRNAWLLPYVHRRLFDDDDDVIVAALGAAGGLGLPALEESVLAFVGEARPPRLRGAAMAALGRMGAMSAAGRLVSWIGGDVDDAVLALTALTEIRAGVGADAALGAIEADLEPELTVAAARYLAELGDARVLPALRRLARAGDAATRLGASQAARAYKAERDRDAGERFLVAMAESDRAVRSLLARRLRTLPVADVLAQAEVLLDDDPAGVVEVLGELRAPEVTRFLLAVAARLALPVVVRARAISAIEADLPWEQAALVELAVDPAAPGELRAAAAQVLGPFVTGRDLLARLGALATAGPSLRAALLWAVQLAVRPDAEPGAGDALGRELERVVGGLLGDPEPAVRRRAAYVAGNLELRGLVPALLGTIAATQPVDVRLAGQIALAELGTPTPAVADQLAVVMIGEDDAPRADRGGARAGGLVRTGPRPAGPAGRAGPGPARRRRRTRARGVGSGSPGWPAARSRCRPWRSASTTRRRRCAAPPCWPSAASAGRRRRRCCWPGSITPTSRCVSGPRSACSAPPIRRPGRAWSSSRPATATARSGPGSRPSWVVAPTGPARAALDRAVVAALARLPADDPAYEPLVNRRIELARVDGDGAGDAGPAALDVDASITTLFPSFPAMTQLGALATLVKSMRTAEALYHATLRLTDADQSPPIVLWMKVMENYVHAWLGGRMAALQREPHVLFSYVERVSASAWPSYQRWLEPRWRDPVDIGGARVDVPVRAITNAMRELQDHRRKRLDSPLSVTEWSRLLVLFAVDHPSGMQNLFKLKARSADEMVRLAHSLHALAAVRNAVTHRAAAGADTALAFRRDFYAAFETLVHLA
jgi:hypothetical protein